MKKRIGAVLSAAAVSLSAMTAATMLSASGADSGTIKILCIGDSITDGYGIAGSYRKFLYHELTEAGYSIDMIGDTNYNYMDTYYGDDGTSFQYDGDHAGHSGYTIVSYGGRSGIYEQIQSSACVPTYSPDIVILQIGTNDAIDNYELDSSGERLTTLIEYILANLPSDSALFVTTIPDVEPNRSDVYSWFNNYRYDSNWQQLSDADTAAAVQAGFDHYNSIVRSTVKSLQSKHANLYLGDVHSAITDTASQLNDGVHPNNVGYARMGKYWANVLLSYLGGSVSQPTVTTTTTTATETVTTTTQTTTTTTTTSATTTTTTTTTATQTETTTEPPVLSVAGDLDGDGVLSLTDLVLLQKHLLAESVLPDAQLESADLSGDSKVNAKDLSLLKQLLLSA